MYYATTYSPTKVEQTAVYHFFMMLINVLIPSILPCITIIVVPWLLIFAISKCICCYDEGTHDCGNVGYLLLNLIVTLFELSCVLISVILILGLDLGWWDSFKKK